MIDLGGVPAEEVEWIDVGWPPGRAQVDDPHRHARESRRCPRRHRRGRPRFLTPEESPSSADAVVYLMRHLHASDVKFLEAFRDTAAGAAQTVCAVGVFSRSDEIGSGRIDSLLSAGKVARRYERDGDLALARARCRAGRGPASQKGPARSARASTRRSVSSPVSSAADRETAAGFGGPVHEGIRRDDAEHGASASAARAGSGSSESAWPPP